MSNIDDGSHDAEIGRIFRGCLERLADTQRDYLEKNPRTAKDVRQSALNSLVIIAEAILKAKRAKLRAFEAAPQLHWPLYVLMMDLWDVYDGNKSPLLMPDTAEDRPSGQSARSTRMAHAKAHAIEVYTRLRAAGWADEDNASEIAKIFQERHVTTKGGNGKETITTDTIKEWARQSRKKNTKNTGVLLDELESAHESLNYLFSEGESYSREACRHLLLEDLRRYVAGTVYDT